MDKFPDIVFTCGIQRFSQDIQFSLPAFLKNFIYPMDTGSQTVGWQFQHSLVYRVLPSLDRHKKLRGLLS